MLACPLCSLRLLFCFGCSETTAKMMFAAEGSFPGHYGFVVEINGVQSVPIFFDHPSALRQISIHTEPEPEPAPLPPRPTGQDAEHNATSSDSDRGDAVEWEVGMLLRTPPCVQLRSSLGAPLCGLQGLARAVNSTEQEPLFWTAENASLGSTPATGVQLFAAQGLAPVFLDVDDDNEWNPFVNPTHSRFSTPADERGVAWYV